MNKQEKPKELEGKDESLKTVDQGLNVFVQTVNNITGLDKSNDGKINNDR